jgi:hypothetical protein
LLFALAGCGNSGPRPPSYDPDAMVRSILDNYDTNKDGRLSRDEAAKSPSLADAFADLDANSDGYLDQDELLVPFNFIVSQKAGLAGVFLRVSQDGLPIANATVTLVPEPFMLGVVPPAKGVSGKDGVVTLRMEGHEEAGVQLGFYKAEVSLVQGGTETIPSQYNTKTKLGKMIGYRWRGAWHIRIGEAS